MRRFPIYVVGCAIVTLSGCFAIYPYDKFEGDENTTAAAGSSSSTSSGGGMGGSGGGGMGGGGGGMGGSSSSSSSSSGSGGSGGATCSPICSSMGTPPCPSCPELGWRGRFGTVAKQHVNAIAANTTGTKVAVVGEYVENAFAVGAQTPAMLELPFPVDPGKDEIMAFVLNKDGGAFWAGEIIPTNTIQPRKANGVAIDVNESRLFVTGYATVSGPQENAFVASFRPTGTSTKEMYWQAQFGGTGFDAGIAIEHDGNGGAFVLGKSSAGAVGLPCPTAIVYPTGGMFVAHFDGTGTCQWLTNFPAVNVVPKAMALSEMSVWVTGYFNGSIAGGAGPILNSVGSDDTFLLELTRLNGMVTTKQAYGAAKATIQGNSIAVSTDGMGVDTVHIAGHLRGETSFASSSEVSTGQTAAFVIQTDNKGTVLNSLVFPGGILMEEAHATSITFNQDRLFVAGTFSGPITVGGLTSTLLGNNPFVAEIETNLSGTKWFHIWKSAGEQFTNHSFFATYRSGQLFFAGSWIAPITFPDKVTFPNTEPGDTSADVIMGLLLPYP